MTRKNKSTRYKEADPNGSQNTLQVIKIVKRSKQLHKGNLQKGGKTLPGVEKHKKTRKTDLSEPSIVNAQYPLDLANQRSRSDQRIANR